MSQARKFNLGLTLANQHPKQIGDLIDDVRGCVSTFLTFRMDADHATALRSAIRPHEPQDLEKLPVFRAMYSACDGSVALVDIPKPPPEPANSRAGEIKTRTMQQYAVPLRTASRCRQWWTWGQARRHHFPEAPRSRAATRPNKGSSNSALSFSACAHGTQLSCLRGHAPTESDERSVRRTLSILHRDGFLARLPFFDPEHVRGGVGYV